ncbi:MAG: phosphomannomutase/phosphoglucomutase [Parcubacteria group bacterium]|nr:phosphomannomutase/phosphoglucomutase [Parcubacteria group bacterium]
MKNAAIFRAYDIRGKTPRELNERVAYQVGRAFAVFLKEKTKRRRLKVVVSRDARASSPLLLKELARGIADEGADVADLGLTSTPLHCFAVNFLKSDGGAMVTASHNPAEYNGFKLHFEGGLAIGMGTGLERVKNIFEKEKFSAETLREGKSRKADILKKYLDFVLKAEKPAFGTKLKAVVDAGNGAMIPELKAVKKRIGIGTVELFFNLDGRFSGRGPNPLRKGALTPAKKAVLKTKADLAAVFDADGDRVVFLDEKGEEVPAAAAASLMADYFLRGNGGRKDGKIWRGLTVGRILEETVLKRGGRTITGKIGRTNAKKDMMSRSALFGAEASGHYYFKKFFYSDSALLAFLCVLKILAEKKRPLSELIKPFRKYFQSGEINVKIAGRESEIAGEPPVFKNLERRFKGRCRISRMDGLSIDCGDFWFNVRKSNTEPILRLNFEAKKAGVGRGELAKLKKILWRR